MGSACTLVVELIRSSKLDLSSEEGQVLATLLILGVYNDTKALVVASASERDISAYSYLMKYADKQEFHLLNKFNLPETYYKNLLFALQNVTTHDTSLVTGLGIVGSKEADDVALIADELARRSGIYIVVVWVIINKTLRLSVRCSDPGVQLIDFLDRFKYLGKGKKVVSGAKVLENGNSEGGSLLELTELNIFLAEDDKDIEASVIDLARKYIRKKTFQD